jgi:integrase
MSTRAGLSDTRDPFAFGEKLLNLLDEGAFTSSPPITAESTRSCSQRRGAEDSLSEGRQGRLSKRWIQALFTRHATAADLPPSRRHVHCLRHYSASRTITG